MLFSFHSSRLLLFPLSTPLGKIQKEKGGKKCFGPFPSADVPTFLRQESLNNRTALQTRAHEHVGCLTASEQAGERGPPEGRERIEINMAKQRGESRAL